MLFLGTTIDGLQMGLCFAILALGMYISYSILDFPDLTMDGSFPLGGVVCTVLLFRLGIPPVLAILLSGIAGALAGVVTGLLHVKLKITPLLSAIITMTALLSVTLALTQFLTEHGNTTTIFSYRGAGVSGLFDIKLTGLAKDGVIIAILLGIVVVIKVLLDLFFSTKLGYMLKASGSNGRVVIALGKDVGNYKILGLALANGLAAMSGAVYAQYNASYDNTCGSGKVVLALASVIIGLALFSQARRVKNTTAVIIGAVIYSLCLNYLVLVDENGIYLKLLNAALFTVILICNDKITALLANIGAKKANAKAGRWTT